MGLVIVVTALDGDFSLRRIERLLALARSSSARALVTLSKSDLIDDHSAAIQNAPQAAPELEILTVSSVTGQGLDTLRAEVGRGRTAVLVGSSGVGKSTLINRLLGSERQRTGPVRESDDRGRHITTRRELLPLPGGGLVIDTPGLREVGLLANVGAGLEVFPEIARLADSCRFSDCRHQDEPECAVQMAVRDGQIGADRLDGYHRLVREQINAERRSVEHERRAYERATVGHYRQRIREAHRFKGLES